MVGTSAPFGENIFDEFLVNAVAIPVNRGNYHWYGVKLDMVKKEIIIEDSIIDRNMRICERVFSNMQRFLKDKYMDSYGEYMPADIVFTEVFPTGRVQQPSSHECGIFTMQYMESIARGNEYHGLKQHEEVLKRYQILAELARFGGTQIQH
jgi:sentrin-specific protease 1